MLEDIPSSKLFLYWNNILGNFGDRTTSCGRGEWPCLPSILPSPHHFGLPLAPPPCTCHTAIVVCLSYLKSSPWDGVFLSWNYVAQKQDGGLKPTPVLVSTSLLHLDVSFEDTNAFQTPFRPKSPTRPLTQKLIWYTGILSHDEPISSSEKASIEMSLGKKNYQAAKYHLVPHPVLR